MAPSLFSVANKTFLITGGSRGIGFHMAKGLSALGANVIISSRTESDCIEAVSKISSSSPTNNNDNTNNNTNNVKYIVGDVSSREGCEALISSITSLDVLVNNAGCAWGEPLERKSGRANWGWDKVLDLNVKGPFYLSVAALPLLTTPSDPNTGAFDDNSTGRIINVGSITGLLPQEAPTHAYDVSKAAIHHLTKKMAKDFAPKGVTVNCIAPGFVPSRMTEGLKSYASFEEIARSTPMQRLGGEEDMVGAVVYFSSRAGSWVTGTVLPVDGGAVAGQQIPLSSLGE